MLNAMIKKTRNDEEIRAMDDMVMSPTYKRDEAVMMRNILMKELPSGIYHVASNSGFCSWFDFAKGIFEMQDIDANLIPIKTNTLQTKAKNPMFSTLVSARIGEYELKMLGGENGLRGYLNEKRYFESAFKRGDYI